MAQGVRVALALVCVVMLVCTLVGIAQGMLHMCIVIKCSGDLVGGMSV